MGDFEGKVVWITGGGTGLGRALAVEVARRGARVAVSGRRKDRLDETVALLGEPSLAVTCDVTSEESQATALRAVLERFGRLDVAVANAGYAVSGRLADLSEAEVRRQFDLNVVGLVTTSRLCVPSLRETKGSLVLIGSVAAFLPFPKAGAYAASKAAVRAIGQTLSVELAKDGIAVTTLHPGFVESELGQVDNAGVFHPDKKDRRPERWMWRADDAARVMANAIASRRREVVFTGHGRVGAFLGQHCPGLTAWVLSRT